MKAETDIRDRFWDYVERSANSAAERRSEQYSHMLRTFGRQLISEWEEISEDRYYDFTDTVDSIDGVLDDLEFATFDDSKDVFPRKSFWHINGNPVDLVILKKAPFIYRAHIEEGAGKYLESNFRNQKLDRLIVQMLLGAEIFAFGNEIRSSLNPIFSPISLIFSKFSFIAVPIRISIEIAIRAAIIYALFSIADVFGEGVIFYMCLAFMGILALDALRLIIMLPFYWVKHRRAVGKSRELIIRMAAIYNELTSAGPVSASHIRHRCEKATDDGVVWPAPLFAMLNDIERRSDRF